MKEKNILTKLAYRFHKLSFYFLSITLYIKDSNDSHCKLLRPFVSIYYFFKGSIINLQIFFRSKLYFGYIEVPITSRCTLKCKSCSNLIPHYRNRDDFVFQNILESTKIFLKCINRVVFFRILGGEPFLSNENLKSLLQLVIEDNKVQRVVIVTNGSIVPKDNGLIELLKNKKVIVSISNYNIIDSSKLVDLLIKNRINYQIKHVENWIDYGEAIYRNKTDNELKKQFKKCNPVCKSLVNGEFHLCPRSAHGTDLKIINDNNGDFVNLLDKNISTKDKKRAIIKLLNKRSIKACHFCIYGVKKPIKIPVAEQIK